MKKIIACLAISLLLSSGIRAPESQTYSRGICWSGATLEKAADSSSPKLEKASSNPLLLRSGFSPVAHPYDFPQTIALSDSIVSDFWISRITSSLHSNPLFPQNRPPINLSF